MIANPRIIADVNVLPVGVKDNVIMDPNYLVPMSKFIHHHSKLQSCPHVHGVNVVGPIKDILSCIKEEQQTLHHQGIDHVIFFLRAHSIKDKPDITLDQIQSIIDSKYNEGQQQL